MSVVDIGDGVEKAMILGLEVGGEVRNCAFCAATALVAICLVFGCMMIGSVVCEASWRSPVREGSVKKGIWRILAASG